MSDRFERKKPSLSASSIQTSSTSGRSSPSRNRLMPTSTSNCPSRRSRNSAARSSVSISACRYRALTPVSLRNSVRSSAMRLVSVVTSTRPPRWTTGLISSTASSTCPVAGRKSSIGSSNPVGRMSCSTISPSDCSISYSPGVAETYMTCLMSFENSSKLSGRLSSAEGSRNP